MRVWLDPQRLTNYGLTPNDVINAIQGQNVQAAVGRIGAAPLSADQQLQLTINTKGRLTQVGRVRGHHRPRQPGRLGGAGQGRGACRAGCQVLGPVQPVQRQGCSRHRHLPVARRQRRQCSCSDQGELDGLKARFPQDLTYDIMYDTTIFVSDTVHEVIKTLLEAFVLVGIVVFVLFMP